MASARLQSRSVALEGARLHCILRALLGLLALAAFSVSGAAATRIVDPGPTTIHEAMAVSAPGDSIVLRPGQFLLSQGVNVRSGVVLVSADGPLATILDMQYQVRGLVLEDLAIPPLISGLGFVHAVAPGFAVGGGILSINSSPEIRNCFFTANEVLTFEGQGGHGSAIAILGGTPIIENNTIVGNTCGGGALFLSDTGGIVRNNVIAFNLRSEESDTGFGITCDNSTADISNNLFWANQPADIHASCSPTGSNYTTVDPQLCHPVFFPWDGFTGDWRVMASSPIAPGGTHSGIGASLGLCASTAAKPTTWGRVKSRYNN